MPYEQDIIERVLNSRNCTRDASGYVIVWSEQIKRGKTFKLKGSAHTLFIKTLDFWSSIMSKWFCKLAHDILFLSRLA